MYYNNPVGKVDKYSLNNVITENFCYNGTDLNIRSYNKLNEEQKYGLSKSISILMMNKLSKEISKIDGISAIESTRGDFKKYKEYKTVKEGLELLETIANQNIKASVDFKNAVNLLRNGYDNLLGHKSEFTKAFSNNNKAAKYIYDSYAVSILGGIGLTFSRAVGFVNDGRAMVITPVEYKKNLINEYFFKTLTELNDGMRNDKFKKVFELQKVNLTEEERETYRECKRTLNEADDLLYTKLKNTFKNIKHDAGKLETGTGKTLKDIKDGYKNSITGANGKAKQGAVILGTVIVTIIVICVIIRWSIKFIAWSRMRLADYLEQTKEMLEANVTTLGNDEKSQQIRDKQLKAIEKLEERAAKISLDTEVTNRRVDSEIESDNKTINQQSTSDDETLYLI